ncbi:hypothetical protein GGR58DRAFT_406818 [Xylaria digitata]|nr:hypothetical protein GGR58DRAFT_406818 [Xylaria digitata]
MSHQRFHHASYYLSFLFHCLAPSSLTRIRRFFYLMHSMGVSRRGPIIIMDEIIGFCVAQVLCRAVLSIEVLVIEKQIVSRRKQIVGIGRAFQRALRLPRCLCAFAEQDPGITEGALRNSSMLMTVSLTVAVPT